MHKGEMPARNEVELLRRLRPHQTPHGQGRSVARRCEWRFKRERGNQNDGNSTPNQCEAPETRRRPRTVHPWRSSSNATNMSVMPVSAAAATVKM